jgi:L-alanine-DL-glutamate epimerase-like enolase superfamily enzyme
VKITDLKIRVVQPEEFVFTWRKDLPPVSMTMSVFELTTDAGIAGYSTSWLPAAPHEIAQSADHFLRPMVVGRDVYDREAIWHDMLAMARFLIPPKAASQIDFALWDIAGKAANLPIYKLLGAYRESIPTYDTMQSQDTPEQMAELVLAAKQRGVPAAKLRAKPSPRLDIAAARLAREAVGPDYVLMFDATNSYDWEDAVGVGRELQSLGFFWYEDPMPDWDLAGYRQLCQALDIPVLMGEAMMRGPQQLGTILAEGAADSVRGVGDLIGGITALRKIGAAAEMLGRRMEPHAYGSTLVQAAHLHYMLAARNCTYFEMPWPRHGLDFGMKTVLDIDANGWVHAPTAPGLGYEIDWDVIDNATVAVY